tara:strand:- start:57 stop:428 length:372 start_codon:yes stop_codon:yes gene_type:complete
MSDDKIDHILGALGEVDFIKVALTSLDKTIRIALSSKEVMKTIGNKGNFAALRKVEQIQAEVLLLNVDLLRIAEEISVDDVMPEPEPELQSQPEEKKGSPKPENPVINNVLDYLHQRMQGEDE